MTCELPTSVGTTTACSRLYRGCEQYREAHLWAASLHLESLKDDYSILVKFCVGAPDLELDFQMTLQAIPREGLAGSPSLFSVTPYKNNDVDACASND